MQIPNDFHIDLYRDMTENHISDTFFPLSAGDRIFFHGDLGAGKSTYIRKWIQQHFADPTLIVRSPTYTYFQKYGSHIYHFDLYRLESLEDFYLIGGHDILENPETICFIEWPEILGESVVPNRIISLTWEDNTHRTIEIQSR